MAVMVWCQSCKKVVWAYDHQSPIDLRGICNLLALPCPKCGEVGNFNGWESDAPMELLKPAKEQGYDIYDDWSAMKYIAHYHGVEWKPSGNNNWFPKELNTHISQLILIGEV